MTTPSEQNKRRARELVEALPPLCVCGTPGAAHFHIDPLADRIASELDAKDGEIERLTEYGKFCDTRYEDLLEDKKVVERNRDRLITTARSSLAQKVLEVAKAEKVDARNQEYRQGYRDAKRDIVAALRDLFHREGIEL